MNALQLMVLLEIDDGSFHACQIGRGANHNKEAMAAMEWLKKYRYVELLGDELFLTQIGHDAIDDATGIPRRSEMTAQPTLTTGSATHQSRHGNPSGEIVP